MVSESSEKKILRERTNQSQITDIFFNFKSDLEKHTFHCHALQCLSVPSFYFHSLFLSILYVCFFVYFYLFISIYWFLSISLYLLLDLSDSVSLFFFLSFCESTNSSKDIYVHTHVNASCTSSIFVCFGWKEKQKIILWEDRYKNGKDVSQIIKGKEE
jgi:hypothetical protein